MKKLALSILFITVLFTNLVSAESKNDSLNTPQISLYCRNINLSFTTIILQNDFTLSSDINIIEFRNAFIGIEPGVSFLSYTPITFDNGSSIDKESPFIDLNLLGIVNINSRRPVFIQGLFGYVYRISTGYNTKDYPLSLVKYGVSLNWNTSRYIVLYIKFSQIAGKPSFKGSAAGFGISVRLYNN